MSHPPLAGEVAPISGPWLNGDLIRVAHCECGLTALTDKDETSFYGWRCPTHGPLDHDAIIFVWEEWR